MDVTGLMQSSTKHLRYAQEKLQCKQLLPLGIWSDAVPFNWDRTQSLEIVSVISWPYRQNSLIRIPICVLNKKHFIKQKTFDAIFEVVTYSMKALANGKFPAARHDQSDWLSNDRKERAKRSGQDLGIKGVLVEVRADWGCMKDACRMPQFNELRGCCWFCAVLPSEIRDVTSTAAWRGAC